MHAACFDEINAAVELLERGQLLPVMGTAGWGERLDPPRDGRGRTVCFNAHAFPAEVPEGAIVFQTENWSQLDCHLLERWRNNGNAIWDMCLPNLARYPVFQPVKQVPVGYHPSMERFKRATRLDIDVIFSGAMNERRKAILMALADRGLNVVHVPHEMYGAERDELLGRAKLALNLQFYPDGAWPALRVAHLVANRVPVLSEWHDDCWPFVAMARYERIVDRAIELLRGGEPAARTDLVLDDFRKMPMVLPS